MKRNLPVLYFLTATIFTTLFFSCKKDNDPQPSGRSGDLLELIKRSTDYNGGGFVLFAEEMARIASASQLPCNAYEDTTLQGNSTPSFVKYTYDARLTRQAICTGGAPTRYNFPVQGQHNFESMRLRDEGFVNMANTLEGLATTEKDWRFTTRYSRSGTEYAKFSGQTSDKVIIISSDNLTVEKASSKISGGTADVQVQYEENGDPVSVYTATITFHGNNRATIRFEGANYQLHW